MSSPEIALLMSTYQRPRHLRLALESILLQRDVAGRMELVVTDDGSTDETPEIVADFARAAPFRVGFTTHPHTTFRLSRWRNEGVRASTAPYILFLDGDCILPPDHVGRASRAAPAGHGHGRRFLPIGRGHQRRVTPEVVRSGEFQAWGPADELRRLRKRDRAARFYRFIRHPTRPKIIGNNVGIWRSDYERVNGYDENFEGWGCEDDDLRARLHAAGVRIASILRWTHTFHLWHPTDVTTPAQWKQGANVNYFLRKGRLTRCRNGLVKRDLADLAVHVVGHSARPTTSRGCWRGGFAASRADKPEVELLFLPGEGTFSGRADCNVLVALDAAAVDRARRGSEHLTIAPPSSNRRWPRVA